MQYFRPKYILPTAEPHLSRGLYYPWAEGSIQIPDFKPQPISIHKLDSW